MLLKGTVRSYDSGAGTAEVEIAGSHGGYVTVPVATHLDDRSVYAGLRCAVLCFDPQDPGDAVLVATYDETPLMGAATLNHDHTGDPGDGGVLTGYIPTTKEDKGCRVYNSAAQTIGDASWTALTFDSEAYDTDGMHSTSTNTSRLTCVTAGKYLVHGQVTFAANATGSRWVAIKKNGTFYVNESRPNAGSSSTVVFHVDLLVDLAVNDYVELFVFQTSGGNLNVNGGNATTAFAAQRLV